ncbi:type VI-A CRISPR-associated RNA-guided ribonuclease Cas13a [Rhodomicrobium sp. Az07]|uniref:type VI-A CRISPR-associated RNA-guided ribonuclease Cas13a n=1 Tax=Rhodomicrobium sp. Az07 TaxID=2839034 RepID=UPI001BE68BCC|nr:type VI-A CRISPR-associated RNA-guided ribonuclease Cas13a [Rhodomicrobium sp. Az07]MBT3070011.1 type VI-A CRISPR-associated RNA-guided ribonuclease Cas13a [Rhodomicrobium sp. Az07]
MRLPSASSQPRLERLPKLAQDGDIISFFKLLSAETASEMRVQRGYESDPEAARKQAGYIDDLLCDVTVLGFSAYLQTKRLDWLLNIQPDEPAPASPRCSLESVAGPEVKPGTDWQPALYLILHLLPVQSAAQLLHQLVRWNIAAGLPEDETADESDVTWQDKPGLKRLLSTFSLYLDMHDAKFEGGFALTGCDGFRKLFKTEAGFNRVFPKDAEMDGRIPRRGLREIMRFGHLPLILSISGAKRIDDTSIDCVAHKEQASPGNPSRIAEMQKRREELHANWVRARRGERLSAADLRKYAELVSDISLAVFSDHGISVLAGGIGPRHEFIDFAHRPAVDEA